MQNNIKKAIYTPNIAEKLLEKFYQVIDISTIQKLILSVFETKEFNLLINYIDQEVLKPILDGIKNNDKSKKSKKVKKNGKKRK